MSVKMLCEQMPDDEKLAKTIYEVLSSRSETQILSKEKMAADVDATLVECFNDYTKMAN